MQKTLKFEENLIPLILGGTKTVTWRMFDDKNIVPGDELLFVNKKTGEEFATAKVLSVRMKALKDVSDADFDEGHERYLGSADMVLHFRQYYGEQVTGETEIKMIKFELLSRKCQEGKSAAVSELGDYPKQ